MLRVARREGRLEVGRTAPGRGAYVHPCPGCLEAARRRGGLGRALRTDIPDWVWARLEQIVRAGG